MLSWVDIPGVNAETSREGEVCIGEGLRQPLSGLEECLLIPNHDPSEGITAGLVSRFT